MTDSDRDLLERAARAAGIKALRDPFGQWRNCSGMNPMMNMLAAPLWNPLTDDGDESRLEVELGIDVYWGPTSVRCFRFATKSQAVERFSDHGGDKRAARRRAGVRAAAAMAGEA